MKKIYIIITVLISMLSACGQIQQIDNPQAILNDSILLSLPKEKAILEEICREIKLNGRIVPDEAKQASVYALVSGRIGEVNVELGDYVKKGQTLAVLKSAEVASVSNEVILAKSNVEIAHKNRDAYKELFESDLIAEREYITACAEYQKALSELQKAENVASITGGENSMYVLKSPLNGYIIAKNITNNSEVRDDMAEPLFSIADLSVVWILADVFEIDINQISLGQQVKASTLSNPDKIYEGKIDKIYNVLDPETRSMKVRAALTNTNNELMPGMYVSVNVDVKKNQTAVAIPVAALILENSEKYVIIDHPDSQPETRPVKEVYRTGNKCYVEGVNDGEIVITGSQVFLFQALNN